MQANVRSFFLHSQMRYRKERKKREGSCKPTAQARQTNNPNTWLRNKTALVHKRNLVPFLSFFLSFFVVSYFSDMISLCKNNQNQNQNQSQQKGGCLHGRSRRKRRPCAHTPRASESASAFPLPITKRLCVFCSKSCQRRIATSACHANSRHPCKAQYRR
jgi:hypothetical protein